MIKVVKFGGSSVANAEQFKKVKKIIDEDESRKFIVTSACGKESHEDHKITDLLYLCQAHAKYGVDYDDIFSMIEDKYQRIKKNLNLKVNLDKEFKQIKEIISKDITSDYLISRGEYLTGLCLSEYLGVKFVDAANIIAFRYDGEIDMERTEKQLQAVAEKEEKILVPGFYGAMPNGTIKVMSRGGSDITGSVLANIVNADIYENWTDVSGFMVTDPKIIKNPLRIPRITYAELRQMSYMGANVLHDDAIFPVRSKNIPINIRNTNKPKNLGTLIMNDCSKYDAVEPPHTVTGITGKKDFTVITVVKSHSSAEVGTLRKLLQVFEEYHISIESVPITVDTFSFIIDSETISQSLYEIIGRIKNEFKPDDIRVEDHLALIAVVGRGMKAVPGASGQFLSEFGRNHINIKIINQSSDELSVVVGVENRDFEKAIKCIYDKFIKEERKKEQA